MICKELFATRSDGVKLYRTYSDQNFMILQIETGVTYSEAIDPEDVERTYEETNTIIETEPSDEENSEESIL